MSHGPLRTPHSVCMASSVNGHLGCFRFLAALNHAAEHICVSHPPDRLSDVQVWRGRGEAGTTGTRQERGGAQQVATSDTGRDVDTQGPVQMINMQLCSQYMGPMCLH